MGDKTKQVLFHIPSDSLAAFDARCRADGRSRSEMLRTLAADFGGCDESAKNAVATLKNPPVTVKPPRSVHVRLTGEEVALAEQAARGYRSAAAWITSLVRRDLLCAAMLSDDERRIIVESTAQLRRIGINLNQIAHRVNVDERSTVTALEVELLHATAGFVRGHSNRIERLLAQSRRRK